jgi:tRNA (uracil-5-)-methyltransferase TRM9
MSMDTNVFVSHPSKTQLHRCQALAKIATNHEPHSCIVADTLNLPHLPSSFDFAICIAVIHHLSTSIRRIEAIKSILELLCSASAVETSGRLLLFVWALEQKSSRRGWDTGDAQDVMVPWIVKEKSRTKQAADGVQDAKYDRYYHLYREGELHGDIAAAGGTILEAGYEKDNWWAICCPNPNAERCTNDNGSAVKIVTLPGDMLP